MIINTRRPKIERNYGTDFTILTSYPSSQPDLGYPYYSDYYIPNDWVTTYGVITSPNKVTKIEGYYKEHEGWMDVMWPISNFNETTGVYIYQNFYAELFNNSCKIRVTWENGFILEKTSAEFVVLAIE